jgi:hypothetical protein
LEWLRGYGERAQTDADDDLAEIRAQYIRWSIDICESSRGNRTTNTAVAADKRTME